MPKLLMLKTNIDNRGKLTVIEKELPFKVKRIFFIYDVNNKPRGGHRHKKTIQALVCIKGKCIIQGNDTRKKFKYLLDTPEKCLILFPEDWHVMKFKNNNSILLVLASTFYNNRDYIYEK